MSALFQQKHNLLEKRIRTQRVVENIQDPDDKLRWTRDLNLLDQEIKSLSLRIIFQEPDAEEKILQPFREWIEL